MHLQPTSKAYWVVILEYILHLPFSTRQYYTSIDLRTFKLIILLYCQRNGFKPRQSWFNVLCKVQVILIFHKFSSNESFILVWKKKGLYPTKSLFSLVFEDRRKTIIFFCPCSIIFFMYILVYCNNCKIHGNIVDSSLRNII